MSGQQNVFDEMINNVRKVYSGICTHSPYTAYIIMPAKQHNFHILLLSWPLGLEGGGGVYSQSNCLYYSPYHFVHYDNSNVNS